MSEMRLVGVARRKKKGGSLFFFEAGDASEGQGGVGVACGVWLEVRVRLAGRVTADRIRDSHSATPTGQIGVGASTMTQASCLVLLLAAGKLIKKLNNSRLALPTELNRSVVQRQVLEASPTITRVCRAFIRCLTERKQHNRPVGCLNYLQDKSHLLREFAEEN